MGEAECLTDDCPVIIFEVGDDWTTQWRRTVISETPDYTDAPFEQDYLEQLAVAATRQGDLELATELIEAADYKRD